MALIPLVAVVGPTASGKTRLAVDLALRFGGEVVSADSMQIYREMNIGTAKPTAEEMRGVPHHMIGIVSPEESFSVADYVRRAKEAIAEIHGRGRLPVVAGGTGLYVDSLLGNIDFGKTERDDALRDRLRATAEAQGGQALLAELAALDPAYAAQMHPNNVGRIIRAIEVCRTSGVTMTELRQRSRTLPAAYDCCRLGLFFADRSLLYARINARVDKMLAAGLLDETRRLLERPGLAGVTSMQAIGYKELAGYLSGAESLEDAVNAIKQGTRRYAKRQMTWFKRDAGTRWIEASEEYENICKQACAIIEKWCPL